MAVLAVLVLGATWIWETNVEKKAQSAEEAAEMPEEVDPFAGGHPVPPMPGQRLIEGGRSATAIDTKPSTPTSAPLAEQEEQHRG